MLTTVIFNARDVRVEERAVPTVGKESDAVIRVTATCVCGSDLWNWRGDNPTSQPHPMGHEYVGVVEHVGSQVSKVKVGQFVVGSFFASDNTCIACRHGFHTDCRQREYISDAQAEMIRIPLADGTLVATPASPSPALIPSLLACSDVLGTGWWAAVAADVQPGSTVTVVGDGAVGLCGILAAKQLGASRVIAMSRHPKRQAVALDFGATDIVTKRGDEGAALIKHMTGGWGADSVLECVGTQESMTQAVRSARPGGAVGFVGLPHGVSLPALELFNSHVRLQGGTAPVRRFLPDLIELVWRGEINPGRVFDITLPLAEIALGYAAMEERRAIKALIIP